MMGQVLMAGPVWDWLSLCGLIVCISNWFITPIAVSAHMRADLACAFLSPTAAVPAQCIYQPAPV